MTNVWSGAAGTHRIGGASSYAEFEDDGTLVLAGDATAWDDLRVPLEKAKTRGANVPAYEQVVDDGGGTPSAGVYAYNFDDGDEIWFSVQMPHSWKLESTIYPHVHWAAEGDASSKNVGLGLEYTWCDIGETVATSTVSTRDVGGDTALKHLLHNVPAAGIAGTGHSLSSVLLCRVFRQAAVADNYAGGIFIMEVDFHFEMDTMGSRLVATK